MNLRARLTPMPNPATVSPTVAKLKAGTLAARGCELSSSPTCGAPKVNISIGGCGDLLRYFSVAHAATVETAPPRLCPAKVTDFILSKLLCGIADRRDDISHTPIAAYPNCTVL